MSVATRNTVLLGKVCAMCINFVKDSADGKIEIIGNKQSRAEAQRRKENSLCASASLRDIKLFPIKYKICEICAIFDYSGCGFAAL